ncbi:hypothetical protein L596_021802 [Steinernema carpocapsae]|uniref:Uncharacterized protein n=1 Tax=Steinernema carpocapsae TaxID=34508 RepID=A0A4U5MK61_STECR|nr:hypothetical protein L596_021802 [Steinernema carpocapsae]
METVPTLLYQHLLRSLHRNQIDLLQKLSCSRIASEASSYQTNNPVLRIRIYPKREISNLSCWTFNIETVDETIDFEIAKNPKDLRIDEVELSETESLDLEDVDIAKLPEVSESEIASLLARCASPFCSFALLNFSQNEPPIQEILSVMLKRTSQFDVEECCWHERATDYVSYNFEAKFLTDFLTNLLSHRILESCQIDNCILDQSDVFKLIIKNTTSTILDGVKPSVNEPRGQLARIIKILQILAEVIMEKPDKKWNFCYNGQKPGKTFLRKVKSWGFAKNKDNFWVKIVNVVPIKISYDGGEISVNSDS